MEKKLFRVITFLVILILSVPTFAQTNTSLFQPLTWEQASLTAARENKLLLVEVTAARKSVHSKIEKDILNNRNLMSFLRRNIIPVRIDVNTPQGQQFLPKLLLYDYPVYAFFMPYGDLLEIVNADELARNVSVLMEKTQNAQQKATIKRNNSRSVNFGKLTSDEARDKAEKEDKLIFAYVFSDNNQASLLMEKNVFNLNAVADYYNRNFINIRIDADKLQGTAIEDNVKEIPAFIFLNSSGKIIYQATGYSELENLLEYGNSALKKAEGISFIKNPEDAGKKAVKENKAVFINYYIPGSAQKELEKTVFSDPEVADLVGKNFISVAVENDVPMLVFTDATGNELHRIVEVKNADEFLKEVQMVLENRGLALMDTRFRNNENNAQFIEEYLPMLERAGRNEDAAFAANKYLNEKPIENLKELKYWNMFKQYSNSPDSPLFRFVIGNRHEFYNLFGKDSVDKKITSVWVAGANEYLKDGVFDKEGFKEYSKRLKKENVENWRIVVRNARMDAAEKTGDWKTFVNLAEEKWNEEKIPDSELYNWGLKIERECYDESIRYKVARWLMIAAEKIAQKERLTGRVSMSSYKGFFEKLSEDLLKKK